MYAIISSSQKWDYQFQMGLSVPNGKMRLSAPGYSPSFFYYYLCLMLMDGYEGILTNGRLKILTDIDPDVTSS